MDNEKLIELARYLDPDPSLVDEIRLCIDQPDEYVERFRRRLRGRGIRAPQPNLPWIALVDGLQARGRLVEIDWKSPTDELQDALEVITQRKEDWEWLTQVEDSFTPPHELFPKVQEQLSAKDLTLVAVEINADCYPLMVLPSDRVAEARRLSALSGYDDGRITSAVDAGP